MMNNWGVPKIEMPNSLTNFKLKGSTKPSLLSSDGMNTNIQGDSNFLGKYSDPNYQLGGGTATPTMPGLNDGKTPEMGGAWMKGANLALGGAQVGLGVWNALEQQKMNKFMRGYYGEEMARNKADFANNALVTNNQIEQQARNRASNAGFGFDSEESKKRTASHMDQWGVKGTFA